MHIETQQNYSDGIRLACVVGSGGEHFVWKASKWENE
jgi:hypothetical protein